jgi:hypothetical protein
MTCTGRVINGVVVPDGGIALPEGMDVRIEVVGGPVESENGSFLDRALRLDSQGRTDDALDEIYRDADRLMHAGEFGRLNELLARVNVSQLSADLTLGILTATLPAKRRLPERTRIFRDFELHLHEGGEIDAGLLRGLEP